ncbi:MAG: hypothetical protein Q8L52_00835 [bacterium]|nr:hypothetical protein [bacterium]
MNKTSKILGVAAAVAVAATLFLMFFPATSTGHTSLNRPVKVECKFTGLFGQSISEGQLSDCRFAYAPK